MLRIIFKKCIVIIEFLLYTYLKCIFKLCSLKKNMVRDLIILIINDFYSMKNSLISIKI